MPSTPVIRPLDQPGDLGWVVQAHGEQYAAEFGWNTELEALIAKIVADYANQAEPQRSRSGAWIAELDGRRAGCVFCVPEGETTAKLRILLVDQAARGHGLGSALVARCVEFAREVGYERVVLWTNDVLVAARKIYLAAGFELVSEEKHHSFGVDLVGQNYELSLNAVRS